MKKVKKHFEKLSQEKKGVKSGQVRGLGKTVKKTSKLFLCLFGLSRFLCLWRVSVSAKVET